MQFGETFRQPLTRRVLLKAGTAAVLASQVTLMERMAWLPNRMALAADLLPDIQFDIGDFIPPAFSVNGVLVRFATVFTLFVPARLTRNPTKADQRTLAQALSTIEAVLPFSPSGVFTFVSYGVPYFKRLPGGLDGPFVSGHLPRTLDTGEVPLVEAVPSPTDISPRNPGIVKQRFNVPVRIESNDMLFTLRSDSISNLIEVVAWLEGSDFLGGRFVASPDLADLVRLQMPRLMFQQLGLPRRVADAAGLPFAGQVNPQSPMWMGFADQQVDASGPARIVTFLGNATARLTTAQPGDYFDNAAIQHLSHDIDDLEQFYLLPGVNPANPDGEPFTERVQYMFRSNQLGTTGGIPSAGNADQFTDGGGPAFLNNVFQGADAALRGARDSAGRFTPANVTLDATFTGQPRIGHEAALQRSSRAADGTPVHVRMDGAGFDGMDVPDGTRQPKLQFTVFVPTAQFFQTMRINVAAQDLQAQFHVDPDYNGLERFITATRRQNFLCPPRRHRAFPLLELT